jgi:hypothetical protein
MCAININPTSALARFIPFLVRTFIRENYYLNLLTPGQCFS